MTRVPSRLAETLLLSLIVTTAGCQSVRGATHKITARKPLVPPLSATPDGVVHADGSQFAGAPLQLANGPAAVGAAQPLIPALPDSSPIELSATPGIAPQVLPQTNRPITPEACLPSETDWRKQMEEQTAALTKRLLQMEGELSSTRTELNTVQQALKTSETKIDQLNQEVVRWKGEFQRLETEMRTQQLSDLKSLDELTESMHQVLMREHRQMGVNH